MCYQETTRRIECLKFSAILPLMEEFELSKSNLKFFSLCGRRVVESVGEKLLSIFFSFVVCKSQFTQLTWRIYFRS